MADYNQLMDAARRADASGDGAGARRLRQLAEKAKSTTTVTVGNRLSQTSGTGMRPQTEPKAINVQAPDGSIVEFPAGTDQSTMERAMQEKYGAQQAKTYEVQGQDGKVYEVQAPDMESAVQAMHSFTGGQKQTASYEDIMAKSRELYASGDTEGAKRLARIAISRRSQPQEQDKGFGRADYDQIMKALRNAHAAGDTAAASRLAQMAKEARAQQPEKGFGEKAKEFLLGDDDPTTQNMGEKIGSFLNKAGESMTFGLVGDEADAAVSGMIPGGKGYDERLAENRQQQELFEKENPGASVVADISGGLFGLALPFGAIGTLGRGTSLGARAAASTAAGAGLGATYGFMEGEGAGDRLSGAQTGAKVGGAVGLATPLLGAGVQRIADNRAARKAIQRATQNAPTTEALRAQGNAAYRAIDDAGVQIKPQSFDAARRGIVDRLRQNTGFDELPGPGSLTPNSARVSQIMDEASQRMAQEPTAALPFKSLDQMRRQAGAAAGNVTNKTDQRAGMEIIGGLDDFVQRMGPDDVVSGDVKALQEALPKARDLWARMSRSQTIDDAIEAGENYLSGGSSGIRNQFSRILKNPKLSRGFSEAEIAAMRRVVNGSVPERVLNLLGGGLGQLGQIGAGFGLGGPVGAVIGAGTGALARKGSEAVSRHNAEIVRALVANGGMERLPVATDGARKIAEALSRRGGAMASQ